MPDLSSLSSTVTLSHLLNIVFRSAGAEDAEGRIILRSYIRLLDKTLQDYELSRMHFTEFVNRKDNGVLSPLFRAIGHMENCLNSFTRTLRFVRSIADHPELGSEIGQLDVLRSSNRKRVQKIRNAIEHMDDRIRKGKIQTDDFTALWMDEDYLTLEGHQIKYEELGEWLSELHTLAGQLADYGAK